MSLRLFVGNIPHSFGDNELGQFVADAGFAVESARVIRDQATGRSRGFGFVELKEGEDLGKAIAALNGKEAGGRALQVNEARPQTPRRGGPRLDHPRRRREPRW